MRGNTGQISLIVVAGLAILLLAFAVSAPAQSTKAKDDYVIIPASEGPNEEITTGDENADDDSADENSLVPKGRHGGAQHNETQQSNNTNAAAGKKNLNKKTSSQNTSATNALKNVSGKTGQTVQAVTHASSVKPQDLAKISIGNKNASAPISLADQGKLGATSIGKQPVSALTGPSASALIGPGSTAKTGIAATDIMKTNLGGLGIKTAPAPGATDTNTNTQGPVTGGGKGSVTTGGVQSGGGAGSNTQGGTVSTGGGNTVGGVQQSGNNDTVNVTQNNTTNVTKVSGGGGGGFGGGGGGGGGEIPSVDVSPIEPEPQPIVVTRVVAAPQDSCPTVVELNQMGFNYYQAGTFNSAEDVFKRALEILDKQLCKDKPLKATTLENLAFTFDKLGKHDDAVKYQEQAQLIRRMQ